MKKRIISILLVLATCISLAACTQSTPTPADSVAPADSADLASAETASEATEQEQFVIGITSFSTASVFSRNAREVLKTLVEEKGGKYIDNVATDAISRAEAVENFISQGVDAIILLSGDVSECEESLNAAKEAGIVIGSCDGGYVDAVDIYSSSDNYVIGEQVVGALVEEIGSGKLLQIYSDAGSMDRKRKGGAADILAQTDGAVTIEFNMSYAWPDYYDDVKSKTEAILLSNGEDINGVFATFAGVGLAALQAIREAGMESKMPIVGVDGDPEALNEIANPDSAYLATVIQSWDKIAAVCVNEGFNKLNGGTISSSQVVVPGILVTKDNVEEIRAQYPELFELTAE